MKRDSSYLIGNKFAEGNKPNKTAFKKGDEPWNKGKKGIHLSPDSEFKKGCKSNRILPVGSLTIRKCKNGKQRNFIKTHDPSTWIELAKYIWLQNYGVILKGDVIHHMNGDTKDDRIENLIALPRKDHPIYHNKWGLKEIPQNQMDYYISRYQ